MTKPKSLDEFVVENPDPPALNRGGRSCSTCDLEHVDVLNAACHDLARRRALPLDDPDAIAWSWLAFYREYVCTQFPGFKAADPRRFFRHVDNCLGIER